MLGLAAWHRTSRSIFNVKAVAAPHMHNLSLLLGTAGPESSRACRLQGDLEVGPSVSDGPHLQNTISKPGSNSFPPLSFAQHTNQHFEQPTL